MKIDLDTDISRINGVGSNRARILNRMGICNARDLLYAVPRGKDKYRFFKGGRDIAECSDGDRVVIKGTVTSAETRWTRGRKKIFEVAVDDNTGIIWGVWFNVRSYITEKINEGDTVVFRGKVSVHKKLQITHPNFEVVTDNEEVDDYIAEDRIVPVYPETEGFSDAIGQPAYRKIVRNVWHAVKDTLEDPIPQNILKKNSMCSLQEMFRFLHFPQNKEEIANGIERYKFQELFAMQLGIARYSYRIRQEEKKGPIEITRTIDHRIRKRFPFEFTHDQKIAIKQISEDMCSGTPMNRLLQGDVGSGKTAVAIYALLAAVANGKQTAFMAPTSILAEQHFRTFDSMLSSSRVQYRLLSGGMNTSERDEIRKELASGEIDVIIGTHALIQEDVKFDDLTLVIVDEQHKFGVLQRKELSDKGYNPDLLVMTATPIPRTLSMTAYGEYDISIIKEMPPGRPEVSTYWITEGQRQKGYSLIKKRVQQGQQVFVVCPLVEETEGTDLKSAINTQVRLGTQVFPDFEVGLIHGKLTNEEKDGIMARFKKGEIDILVSTLVIEVGVDVPNATVMMIEHAERFGLAQLHQLRGRIGRGSEEEAICLLFAECETESAKERITIMAETNDGFEIAEKDFQLRGPGEYFGTKQHGMPSFYLADLTQDSLILQTAREQAFSIIKQDPGLEQEKHAYLRELVHRRYRHGVDLLGVT